MLNGIFYASAHCQQAMPQALFSLNTGAYSNVRQWGILNHHVNIEDGPKTVVSLIVQWRSGDRIVTERIFCFARFTNGYVTNGCGGGEMMGDKNNMTSGYESSSSTRQMTALKAAQAMFANAPPPPTTTTGEYYLLTIVRRRRRRRHRRHHLHQNYYCSLNNKVTARSTIRCQIIRSG